MIAAVLTVVHNIVLRLLDRRNDGNKLHKLQSYKVTKFWQKKIKKNHISFSALFFQFKNIIFMNRGTRLRQYIHYKKKKKMIFFIRLLMKICLIFDLRQIGRQNTYTSF